ncbi:hypothetical protein [Mariniflexile sp.]|uniref:hypothetical protein n=1 Tax=Mariniflexile sp. TaxID=1979402 RepID=UPI004047621A
MKKITFLLLITVLLLFSNKADAQTLTFTSDGGTVWDDGIANDGEGGSTDISGLVIEIFNVDDALTNIGELEWKSAADLANSNLFPGLTTFVGPSGANGWKGQTIKEASGNEFQINGFEWYDWGNNNSQPMTVIGFKNGSEVASTAFTGNSNPNSVVVSLGPDFDDVDEVRIITTDGTGSTYPSINNIEIADTVLSSESNTLISSKVFANNKKFVSNENQIYLEVYNLLGQKLENYNLCRGIYIIKATLKDKKTAVFKSYLK